MLFLYHEVIYRPLLNILVFIYNALPGHDIGITIIVLTVLIRLIMAPSFQKSLQSQKAMNNLQPKLNEIREKHKDNKEEQAKVMMDLYREHKVNPLSSCLPLLIQLPILIALYQVFNSALAQKIQGLYSFISNPGYISPVFIHLIDLSKPSWVLAIAAGALQFWQSRLMLSSNQSNDATAKAMAIQTTYVLPLLSVFIAWRLPAGLPLYWVVTTIFAIAQQYYIMRKPNPQ